MPEENEYYLSSTEITSQNFILKKCLSDEQKLRAFAASTPALQEIFIKPRITNLYDISNILNSKF